MDIILNGRTRNVDTPTLSYADLAYMAGISTIYTPTITYSHKIRFGSLTEGETITIEDHMVFNVLVTGSA